MRLLILIFVCASMVSSCAVPPAGSGEPAGQQIDFREIALPAQVRANHFDLAEGPDGSVYLAWADAGTPSKVKLSVFNPERRTWSGPVEIASGDSAMWLVSLAADVRNSGAAVAWIEASRAYFSVSADSGQNWSPARPLSPAGDNVGATALTHLSNGQPMAVWSVRGARSNESAVFARILPAGEPAMVISAAASPVGVASFPDGSAVITGQTTRGGLVRAQFDGSSWQMPRTLYPNPVPEVREYSVVAKGRGGRMAVGWVDEHVSQKRRIFLSISPDAGGVLAGPQQIDLGRPAGSPGIAITSDGAVLAAWAETSATDPNQASAYFARLSPSGGLLTPSPIGPAAPGPVRMALSRTDKEGRVSLIAISRAAMPAASSPSTDDRQPGSAPLQSHLVTLPSPAALATLDDACGCSGAAMPGGYGVRGRIVGVAEGRLKVAHSAVPGLFRAGERELRATPEVVAGARAGNEFIARIEEREGVWWLYDLRILGQASP